MKVQKLTPGEIKKTVEKIRKRYEEYIYKYFKRRSLKRAFEDRYIKAIKTGVDISSFLLAEIGAISELIKREEKRIVEGNSHEPENESVSEKIDKVVEESRQKILKYPDIIFHKDAGEEVRHLLGALNRLEEMYWEKMTKLLRDTAYSRTSLTLTNLESQLRYLAGMGDDGVPSGLSRCFYLLNQFPRNYQAIDREEKEYILESAFFLHDSNEVLERVSSNYPQLNEGTKIGLNEIQDYVLGIIRDFRAKDLKREK